MGEAICQLQTPAFAGYRQPITEASLSTPVPRCLSKSQAGLTYTLTLCIAHPLAVAGTARRTLLPSLPTTSFTSACYIASPRTSHQSRIAFRPLHSSTSSASPELVSSSTSATSPITSIAKQGSNQLSLEQPRNNAGA